MALFTSTGHGGRRGVRILPSNTVKCHPYTHHHHQNRSLILFRRSPRRALDLIASAKKLSSSSRTGRFDSKNRRSAITTRDQEDDNGENEVANGDTGTVDNVDDD